MTKEQGGEYDPWKQPSPDGPDAHDDESDGGTNGGGVAGEPGNPDIRPPRLRPIENPDQSNEDEADDSGAAVDDQA